MLPHFKKTEKQIHRNNKTNTSLHPPVDAESRTQVHDTIATISGNTQEKYLCILRQL